MFRLLSAALFGVAVLADETKPDLGVSDMLPMRGELVTCPGGKLNSLVWSNMFITVDCDIETRDGDRVPVSERDLTSAPRKAGPCLMFPELRVRFVHGRLPEIFFGSKGERSETEDKVSIEKLSREEIHALLVSRGFNQKEIPEEVIKRQHETEVQMMKAAEETRAVARNKKLMEERRLSVARNKKLREAEALKRAQLEEGGSEQRQMNELRTADAEIITGYYCGGCKLKNFEGALEFLGECGMELRRKRGQPTNRKAGPCQLFPELGVHFSLEHTPTIAFGGLKDDGSEDEMDVSQMSREEIETLLISRGFTKNEKKDKTEL